MLKADSRLGCRLQVVVEHTAVGQRQIGDEMVGRYDPLYRKVGDRRVDVRDQMEPARSDPGALHDDIGQIIGYELADAGLSVHARDQFQIDLGLR